MRIKEITKENNIMKPNYDYNLYIDADGVLADFDKKVREITKGSFDSSPKHKIWASIQHYNDTVEPFFESLDKMPDADMLMNFARENFGNVYILTAAGFTPRDAGDQKRRWFARHYGKELIVKVVTKSPDKAQFASENSILVDDRSKSIDPWVSAGGIGILHNSARNSITQLEKILKGEGRIILP